MGFIPRRSIHVAALCPNTCEHTIDWNQALARSFAANFEEVVSALFLEVVDPQLDQLPCAWGACGSPALTSSPPSSATA